MPADLPPFNPNARCPKCAYDAVETEHWPERNHEDAFGMPIHMVPGMKGHTWAEHLRRTCARCGYSWAEAPTTDPPDEGAQRDVTKLPFAEDGRYTLQELIEYARNLQTPLEVYHDGKQIASIDPEGLPPKITAEE